MAVTISNISNFLDGLRGGPNVELSEETEPIEPTPPQSMQGLAGALEATTTQASSEGTSLTLENLERMVENVTASQIHSSSNQTATEIQLQREATRQINRGIQEANTIIPYNAEPRWDTITPNDINITHAPVPVSPEEANKLFPKDKDWEKLYRSRKSIEEKVSHILIHSQNKVEEVKKALVEVEYKQIDMRKAVREGIKQTKSLNRDIRELKKRKKELEEETEEKKKLRATRVIQDILALPKVKKIEVDEKKRIFITTDEMEVKKDYWDKPRVAGQYQILVDFYQTGIRPGIRVLNITRRFMDQYDHPCINHTNPCWGNIEKEMRESFRERDLLEIVITMLLYISSPNDDTGWIEYSKKAPTERHKQGWEQFLEFATPCPKNFSFRKYEKQQERRMETGSIGTPSGIWDHVTALGGMASVAQNIPLSNPLLPALVVPTHAVDSAGFLEVFSRYIGQLMEFRDPFRTQETIGRIIYGIENSGILFIKSITLIGISSLEITGWTTVGERRSLISLTREDIHIRDQRSLFFEQPSWFMDIGRPESPRAPNNLQYYGVDSEPVQIATSVTVPNGNMVISNGTAGTTNYNRITMGGGG